MLTKNGLFSIAGIYQRKRRKDMTIKVVLRKEKKKDRSHAIRIRITENRKPRFINVGESIHESYWDEQKQRVKESHSDSERINAAIEALLPNSSINNRKGNFISYWHEYIADLKSERRIGNRNKHRTSLKIFSEFAGDDVPFRNLNLQLMKDYKHFLAVKYDNPNTQISYLKKLRKMVNDGIKDGIIINDPFRGFDFPKATDSKVKALESHQLNELYDIKCRSNSKYLNIWFACFYLQGARIGDVLRMKYGDIDNDKIVYNMKKTKKRMSVEITPKVLDLLNEMDLGVNGLDSIQRLKELSVSSPDEYIFPFLQNGIHNSSEEDEYENTKMFTALINKEIKKAGILIGTSFSCHVARHTYATLIKDKLDVYTVQKLLGHSSVKTTEGYIASLPDFKLHELNRSFINGLFGN